MGDQHTDRDPGGTQRRSAPPGHGEAPDTEPIAPVLTASEAAALLGVTPMTVYRLIRSGTLTALRVGGIYRIPERAVRSYLAELRERQESLHRPPRP